MLTIPTARPQSDSRLSHIDVQRLSRPAALIFNPNAGRKLGLSTNSSGAEMTQQALEAAGVPFEAWPTERAGHATDLARKAVQEGRALVVAAGGDGTVAEVAQGLAGTEVALGVMPLGSVMNVARMLCIPRDLDSAAAIIARGNALAMDLGRCGQGYFLEAAGVGLDAGLFGYFNRLDRGAARPSGVVRAAMRFLRDLGRPYLVITADDLRLEVRAPMVAVANGPFVGAAYNVAPDARIDDGLLDVVVFRGASPMRVLLHLALVAGGRALPPPAAASTLRVRRVEIAARRHRPLPVHADGQPVGVTPFVFEAAPGALRVLVGTPSPDVSCAWVTDGVRAPESD